MLIILIILLLCFGGGGGYYGYNSYGPTGGFGIGIGGILFILLLLWLFGVIGHGQPRL